MSDEEAEREEGSPPKTQAELDAELLVAVKQGRHDVVKKLVEEDQVKPQPIEETTGGKQKWCPLVWGIFKGYTNMVTLLLEHGFGEPYHHSSQNLDVTLHAESKKTREGHSS